MGEDHTQEHQLSAEQPAVAQLPEQLHSKKRPRLIVRESLLADCFDLAPRLRAPDIAEIQANSGETPLAALRRGRRASQRCLTVEGERPLAMFGVVRDGDYGAVWMLGSDGIFEHRWQFLRECREHARDLTAGCTHTGNVVDCRNTAHIRWIIWMGWRVVEVIPRHGHERRPFFRFHRTEPPCVTRSHSQPPLSASRR